MATDLNYPKEASMNTLKQLPELTALVEAGQNPFNQVLMDYVDQGGKTVGFMYQDTPEEIITALLRFTFAAPLPKEQRWPKLFSVSSPVITPSTLTTKSLTANGTS